MEMKYYGLHACLELWKKRPKDIVRVYLESSHVNTCKALLKWCASQKKAYHIVPNEELHKITDSTHHEGICILAKVPPALSPEKWMEIVSQKTEAILYLDGVQNPHNLGSIIRSAAHFGIKYIVGEKGKLPELSPSACRIAQGGAEFVQLIALPKPIAFLTALRNKGYALIGTSSHAKKSLYTYAFQPKTIFIIGGETAGISKEMEKVVDEVIQIPGTGHVESLNVAIAASLIMNSYMQKIICT